MAHARVEDPPRESSPDEMWTRSRRRDADDIAPMMTRSWGNQGRGGGAKKVKQRKQRTVVSDADTSSQLSLGSSSDDNEPLLPHKEGRRFSFPTVFLGFLKVFLRFSYDFDPWF